MASASEMEHFHKFSIVSVDKISGDSISLKTEKGGERSLSIKETEKEGIFNLKEGDKLYLEIDEGNQIVDIDRLTAEGHLDHPEDHQTVIGELVRYEKANREVMIRVEGGQIL